MTRSLQFKLTCWAALMFAVVMLLILVAFNIYAVRQVARQRKAVMQTISRSIVRELVEHGVRRDGPVPAELIDSINEKIAFVDRKGRIAYAIVSSQHQILYRSPGFNIPVDRKFLGTEHDRLFLQSVGSGSALKDALSEWRFLFRYQGGGNFIIFVSDHGDYELLERFGEGMGVVAIIVIVLAVPFGLFVSRKTLEPLSRIDAAAELVRAGDLSARIAGPASGDEFGRLVDKLNSTFADLEASFDRISQFSGDVAHELRTPLTAVQGGLEVCLAKERTVEQYQRCIAETVEETAALSRMVEDLLLIAKPSADPQGIALTDVDLAQSLAQTIERLQPIADEAEVSLVPEIRPDTHVIGESGLLVRLCQNLVHNAIRFSPAGATVVIRLTHDSQATILAVIDRGVGIAPEDQQQIFQRFYQVDTSRGRGSGLGLAIVKWITEIHNARIELDSALGVGSTFRVIFPRPA